MENDEDGIVQLWANFLGNVAMSNMQNQNYGEKAIMIYMVLPNII